MSASSSSNAEEIEEEQHQLCSRPSLTPVSANNADPNRARAINPNVRPTSAAHTDSDQHYRMKLRSHAHSSTITPATSSIFDAATTSDIVEASIQRSTIVSSEQISHYMASTELDDNSPGKRKSYSCRICHEPFRSGQSLGGHMNSHRNANANPRQEVDQEAGGQSGTPFPPQDKVVVTSKFHPTEKLGH